MPHAVSSVVAMNLLELSLRLILLSSALIFAKWERKEYRFVNEKSFHQMGYIEEGLLLFTRNNARFWGWEMLIQEFGTPITPTPDLEEFLI